jgi:apolipoprotein N-acyltransferase
VLAWLVLIPYSLVGLPSIIMEIADKDYKYNDISTGKRIGIGALVYILIFFVGCMLSSIGWFFVLPTKDSFYSFAGTIGFLLWVVTIVLGVIEGFKAFKEWNYRRKIKYDENGWRIYDSHKEEKTYLVVEFAKAKYNKYCPKIDWVDKK